MFQVSTPLEFNILPAKKLETYCRFVFACDNRDKPIETAKTIEF